MSVQVTDATGGSVPQPAAVFSPAYRRYVLIVLMLVYTISYVDRQILSILMEPIKNELGISDTSLGFLSGVAFALFYATLGVPIAILADRKNRRNIIALSVAVFSGMTLLCGLAMNFWQLALARIGVGVGEAGSSPPSHSIISDIYPPSERGAAFGIMGLGTNIGTLTGFLIGGWVAHLVGWREAFLIVSVPGLILALIVRYTLREPPRGLMEAKKDSVASYPVREVIRFVTRQKAFVHIAAGTALFAFIGYGASVWKPSFFMRSFGLSTAEVGTYLALLVGTAGVFGTYMGGWLGDKLGKRDVRWNLWIVSIFWTINVPILLCHYLSPNVWIALALYVVPAAAGAFFLAPALAMTQALVRPRMRAVASAVLFLVINLVGLGIGPQMVGILSDIYHPIFGIESLRYSMMTFATFGLWGAAHYYMASRHLIADLERVKQFEGAGGQAPSA